MKSTRTEIIAGITNFLACAYIIFVNPNILAATGLPKEALITSTVFISAFATILMGLYAKLPIVLAPGMGLNAYFAYSVVIGNKIPPEVALGIVFWSGILFIFLSIFKVREWIIRLIPTSLKYAITVGIGLFIATIGLMNAKVIVDHPATLITGASLGSDIILFGIGLLITTILFRKKIPGSFLIGILLMSVLIFITNQTFHLTEIVSRPDFSLFLKIDFMNSLKLALIPTMLSFLFTDLFDTVSTFMGVCEAGNLLDKDGNPKNMSKGLLVDAIATTFSGLVGVSPTTSYIESSAGVISGGRTGLTSVITGLCFVPFLFLAPLISIIPQAATAPILVLVGVQMTLVITKIEWNKMNIALPCFLTILLMPLSFSISTGICAGLVSYLVLNLNSLKTK